MWRCGLVLLTALTLFADDAPPDAAAQQAILDGVKRTAARYQQELPDFVCTLLTQRFQDDSGKGKKFKRVDTDEVEVRFVGRRAYRTVLKINNKPAKNEPLVGFRSDGVLPLIGFLPEWLLGPSAKTRFDWARWDTQAGRRAALFHLQLSPADSRLPLSNAQGAITVGLHGFMYVDPADATVLRMELELEVPPNSPLDVVNCSFDLDYAPIVIAGEEFFLPSRTQVLLRNSRALVKNETEVVRYQKYTADSSVQFGESDR